MQEQQIGEEKQASFDGIVVSRNPVTSASMKVQLYRVAASGTVITDRSLPDPIKVNWNNGMSTGTSISSMTYQVVNPRNTAMV